MNTKLNWNFQQQEYLRQIVENKKNLTWNQIAVQMNKHFPDKIRTGKQYRQRYVNYVQFLQSSLKNNTWTEEEQRTLFKSYRQLGTKWTIIAKIIITKSENSLKNKFYGALRKTLRKINRIGKQNIKKFNKLIRYQSLIRIMDAAQGAEDLPYDIKINSQEIKQKILTMAQSCQSQFQLQQVSEIIKQIHKFNIATRCYSSKKWKKSHSFQKEIKIEQGESYCGSSQKEQKQSTDTKKSIKKQSTNQNILQQNSRQKKENDNNQMQKLETSQHVVVKVEQMDQKLINRLHRDQQLEQQLSPRQCSDINNDLQFELCGILHENYVPQYFDYFQQ